ncbi:hypothetical protein WKI65_37755 [Streptomyces sp. MS1.AVA.3]|uniref:hypothetical protein n=1 Tax=Streptomyces decoyicus TaxID=249567 RepID=UPI0030BB3C7E
MPTDTSAFTEPDRPANLQIRFLTAGGSYVDDTGPGYSSGKHRWNCHGCKERSNFPEQDHLRRIRSGANEHAGICRAIPLT